MGEKLVIGFKLNGAGAKKPEYEHVERDFLTIFASTDTFLSRNRQKEVQTGVIFKIPKGCVGVVSGFPDLVLKCGLKVINDNIGHENTFELNIIMENNSDDDYEIKSGEKIARMIVIELGDIVLEEEK